MTDDPADPFRPLTLDEATPRPAAPVDKDTLTLDQGGPAPPRRDIRPLAISAVAVAALLVVLVAVAARPRTGAADAEASISPGDGMQVEMAEPPPLPVPKAGAPLEVLAPDMAEAAARSAELAAQQQQLGAAVEDAAAPEPAPIQASFDCGGAGSPAEEMVCSDAGLAAADREMARAYRAALASGAPPRELRDEQQDWYDVREDAARLSPRAVARVYAQRIDELRQIADAGPR